MAGLGRPSDYTPELAADICSRLAAGSSLRAICMLDSMPCASTVFLWLTKHQEFSDNYAKAIDERAAGMFDDMLDIADDVEPETACVAKARLRVDTRKWALARMNPKKYGDKIQAELGGPDGGAIAVTWLKPE